MLKERDKGRVGDDECAVLLLAGSGLKYIAAAQWMVAMPGSIEPSLNALLQALKIE